MPRVRSRRRVTVTLECTDCKSRNYRITKKPDQQVELKKFCKTCGKHSLHRDTK